MKVLLMKVDLQLWLVDVEMMEMLTLLKKVILLDFGEQNKIQYIYFQIVLR